MVYAEQLRTWSLVGSMGALLLSSTSGCIQDTDCGICDPNNLVLESISGVNYASNKVHVLGPACQGEGCPGPITEGSYFLEDIIPCEETEKAQASPNAQEYCRLSPLVTAFGIEFIFNNLLDPTSIELVRKRPDNPQLFEVYDWKPDVLQVQGPITRYNGDYAKGEREAPDSITRLINLSCIENVAANGGEFSHLDYADPKTNPCNTVNPTTGLPMKLSATGTIKAARGITTANSSSCTSPEEGPDTCCNYCDYLLSTKVERYGVDDSGTPRNSNPDVVRRGGDPYAAAIECGGGEEAGTVVDRFAACADFVPSVDRGDEEQRWEYAWCSPGTSGPDCPLEVQIFDVPLFDKLRETHPDRRPAGMENLTAKCTRSDQCASVHGLSGTECVGVHAETGDACLAEAYEDGTCQDAVCRPQWVGTCVGDPATTGSDVAYCQDRRFTPSSAGACLAATGAVEQQGTYGSVGVQGAGMTDCDENGEGCVQRGAGSKLAFADWNENGTLTAEEACQGSLYGPARAGQDGFACDPLYQGNLAPLPLYERDENLPSQARRCICPDSGSLEFNRDDLEEQGCLEAVERGCYDGEGALIESRAGRYAVKMASPAENTRAGGIIYDPAVKGFEWRPADLGGIPRADLEDCAARAGRIGDLNRHDGWRASDDFTPETFEDFDRAMCSGQTYTVIFNEPGTDNPSYVIDKADNTLAGKSVYTFETPQFHVQPDSGFPTDNLRIGACDDFSLRFSNKYDASPENLAKLQIYRMHCEGIGEERVCELAAPDPSCDTDAPDANACCPSADSPRPVAGGPGCHPTQAELDAARELDPCAAPCLTIDVEDQFIGKVDVQIDPAEFGRILRDPETYQLLAPMADTVDRALGDASLYDAVFWDACGMPLVAQDAQPYAYTFTIDRPKCKEDQDRDGVPFSCDNDGDTLFNPNQDDDFDRDGFGLNDLCPVVAGSADDTADSDNDGVGNECDNCRQTLTYYNANADRAAVPDRMWVRNIPDQTDTDHDGVGDACDNCVVTANCEGFGPESPYEVGTPISLEDPDLCQGDDGTMIGNACRGQEITDFAAGPVGFEDEDDFDQDGIINILDGCPRQPLPDGPIACSPETAETDCGPHRACTNSVCNHLDSDDDGIGNICDTCAFEPNPNQDREGASQDDDPDGDFVGEVCEIGATNGCGDRKNARPFGFFEVSAAGNCCTTQLIEADAAAVAAAELRGEVLTVGDLLLAATCTDPADLSRCVPLTGTPFTDEGQLYLDEQEAPILDLPVRTRENCSESQEAGLECFALPATLEATPGILEPPPGCEAELDAAGLSALENLTRPLSDADFADASNPLDRLWNKMCFLPQTDQDYDGIADPCDLCRFAFDPSARPYVNDSGVQDPGFGAACNGALRPDEICELKEEAPGEEEMDTEGTSGGPMGGSSSTGG